MEHHGATILLVDDLPDVRRVTRLALEAAGHQVFEASDGPEALEVARHCGHLDLLLTDVGMPGMDGPTLAQSFARRQPHVPVLFVSADRSFAPPTLRGPRRAPFLAKPYRPAEIVRAVESALSESA